MIRQEKQALDHWIQKEDTPLTADCPESKEYCGKCPRSSCLWLMHEAFKPEEEPKFVVEGLHRVKNKTVIDYKHLGKR